MSSQRWASLHAPGGVANRDARRRDAKAPARGRRSSPARARSRRGAREDAGVRDLRLGSARAQARREVRRGRAPRRQSLRDGPEPRRRDGPRVLRRDRRARPRDRPAPSSRDARLVIGCGPVGLAVIAALRLKGARPIVAADFSLRRRELAIALGADVVVDPAATTPWQSWREVAVWRDPSRAPKLPPWLPGPALRPAV